MCIIHIMRSVREGRDMNNDADAVRDAHAAIVAAIADLRRMGISVPMALHRAAHALAYAIAERPPERPPGTTLQ
jgi:hypothetical protein